MNISPQPYRFGIHLVEELHDNTPELFIHDFAPRLDRAKVGDLVGIRMAGSFDSDWHGVTSEKETCLLRTETGIAECPLDDLENRVYRESWGVKRFLEAQHRYWGWLEVAGDFEPLGGELRPDNAGIDVLYFRDAIGVLTRPDGNVLPLARLVGLPGMVAALFLQDPATARRGKVTRRTVSALAKAFAGISGMQADRALLAWARDHVSGRRP